MICPCSYVTDTISKSTYKDLKTGISIDFKWSKYRSQMISQ